MALKSILVPFLEDRSARLAFEAAVALAKHHRAHIRVLHIRSRPMPPPVYYPLDGAVSADITEELREAEAKTASDLHMTFKELCKASGVGLGEAGDHSDAKGATASWRDKEGVLPYDVAGEATAADVTVAASPGKEEASFFQTRLIEELLFQSGRPVLLCPPSGMKSPPKCIVVAWNGRPEAARAVGAGLAFLRDADDVRVVTIRKPLARPVNTDEIIASLRLHGVLAAKAEAELEKGHDELDSLSKAISQAKPDLIIMGAYSHNRWREAVLGGFTRRMLHEPTAPVLMMH